MAGNVWQFVYDWYDAGYYSVSPSDYPTGPSVGQVQSDGKAYRGMRGGSWYNGDIEAGVNDGHSRVSNRCPASPTYFAVPQLAYSSNVGFRLVRNANSTTLSAGFTYTPSSPASAQTVAFADASSGGASTWSWNFGDSATSPLESPTHTYSTDGIYTATLTVTGAGGTSVSSQSVIVNTAVTTRTVGLMLNTSNTYPGYTLFSPKQNAMTYLIDNEGRIVHEWTASKYSPGQSSYLLENGHLLRPVLISRSRRRQIQVEARAEE